MQFEIEYTDNIERKNIKYIGNEFSFSTEPFVNETDFDLVYNKVNLTVVDKQIVQIWGYAGDVKWTEFTLSIPAYKKGVLKINDQLEYGFCYSINDNHLPIHHNKETGWICIGNPLIIASGVEFIKDCVAFIDLKGSLTSLWIKPIYE